MPAARPLPYENIRILDPSRSAPLASIKDANAMPREAAEMKRKETVTHFDIN